ncbi:MAG: ankyrin repeat domain-containing protein [Alphaproteobacteria bacterium]
MRPFFNDKALPWRQKKIIALIEADDGPGMAAFLEKFPKAVEWEEVHGPNHQTWIHRAAKDRKYKAAGALLEAGAKLDTLGIGGVTLVHTACRLHYSELPPMDGDDEAFLGRLLAKGADINQDDCREFSTLKTAAWGGKVEVVKCLLARGADADTGEPGKDGARHTILMDMAMHNGWRLNIVKAQEIAPLLIAAGADVNRQNDVGMTPLFFARDMVIAQMLLDKGADPEHIDKRGRHIWDVEGNLNQPVAGYLRTVAEERQQARKVAALEKDVDAACHDGVTAVKLKPLVFKKGP